MDSQFEKNGRHCVGGQTRKVGGVAEQQDVSKEEAAVKTKEALDDRYGDRILALGRHRNLKKQTQDDSCS
jgi:hypothetical protein